MNLIDNISKSEVWRPIKGFNGYSVSNFGRIVSFKRNKQLVMTSLKHNKGYSMVKMTDNNGKAVNRFVHRLVLQAFSPCNDHSLQCNHKNGIKTDNRLTNLEWVTPAENIHHALRMGLFHKKSSGDYKMYDFSGNLIKSFITAQQAVDYLLSTGLKTAHASNIYAALNNPKLSAYKYRWVR